MTSLSTELIHSTEAAGCLARIADIPFDADGALHFGCLLNLAQEPDGALWWWQFAAGAGNATAAYCLHLFHLVRGELRDSDHWAGQALNLDTDIHLAPPTPGVSAGRRVRPGPCVKPSSASKSKNSPALSSTTPTTASPTRSKNSQTPAERPRLPGPRAATRAPAKGRVR
ncbi:hypothetical protein [Streptomyces spiralis]|uniref:hypothetical protein n=1 Tax=Streptomyces spiralis TaxID=66376 RepID=UPI0033EEC54C